MPERWDDETDLEYEERVYELEQEHMKKTSRSGAQKKAAGGEKKDKEGDEATEVKEEEEEEAKDDKIAADKAEKAETAETTEQGAEQTNKVSTTTTAATTTTNKRRKKIDFQVCRQCDTIHHPRHTPVHRVGGTWICVKCQVQEVEKEKAKEKAKEKETENEEEKAKAVEDKCEGEMVKEKETEKEKEKANGVEDKGERGEAETTETTEQEAEQTNQVSPSVHLCPSIPPHAPPSSCRRRRTLLIRLGWCRTRRQRRTRATSRYHQRISAQLSSIFNFPPLHLADADGEAQKNGAFIAKAQKE